MKIKSLLLGSAAALVAVSSAQAADAIVVEPEPVEYVRVCDAYGSGFFYIPGTETCMSLNGYVRSQYQVDHINIDGTDAGVDVPDNSNVDVITGRYIREGNSGALTDRTSRLRLTEHDDRSEHSWTYRARLNIDVRNETEWGTLRSQMRIETSGDAQSGDTNAQDGNAVIDRALISLGGFRLGFSDSFTTTHHGYGYHRALNDGFYSFDQAIFFDYTWAANGFSVTVGAQDSENAGGQFNGNGGIADFYAGFAYSGSWGRLAVSALHDGRAWGEDDLAHLGTPQFDAWRHNEGAWTWRASLDLDLSEYFAGGGLRGWYAASDSPYNNTIGYCGGADAHTPCDHEWGISMQASLGDNLNAYVGYSAVSGNDNLNDISYDAQDASIGLVWTPVTGLTIQPEYNWQVSESNQSAGVTQSGLTVDGGSRDTDRGRFRLRITRSW